MKLRLDEKESKLYVAHKDCKVPGDAKAVPPTADSACPSKKKYNPMTSKPDIVEPVDAKNPVEPIKRELNYDSNVYSGYYYKDQVCLNKKVDTSCVAKQTLFSVIQEKTAVTGYDGMIGISKNSDFFKNLLATGHYENVFSVHIGKDGAKSHLTFGGFDPAYMATPNMPPTYFTNLLENNWKITTTSFMFGTTVTFNSKFTDTNIMINSN